jgi:hypothetical protein
MSRAAHSNTFEDEAFEVQGDVLEKARALSWSDPREARVFLTRHVEDLALRAERSA